MTAVEVLPYLSAEAVEHALTRAEAAEALTRALLTGLDPSRDTARQIVEVDSGQLLLMPSQTETAVGLKAVTVAPGNASRGLPRIHGAYLHFDSKTLQLRAILDGVALTNLRTPAVSIAAITPLLSRLTGPIEVVVFGAGPQAVGHVAALEACGSLHLAAVTYVALAPEQAAQELPSGASVVATGHPSVVERLGRAHLVVCATTARTPLFDSGHLADGAIVIAMGSHEPQARELDGALMGRADVIVEDVRTALREAGDVIQAIDEGHLRIEDLIPLADVVCGRRVIEAGRTVVFKSVGMSWQDVVVAQAVMQRLELG